MIKVECLPHPSKRKAYQVIVDEEVFREIATACDLAGSYTSYEAWTSTWDQWEIRQIKAIAYDRLSRKSYFSHELKLLIAKLGFSDDKIEEILAEIQKLGYLNDEESVERYIQQGIRKKKSPTWIRYHLSQKVGESMEVAYPKEVRESVIRELLLKNRKKGQKAIGVVARKGFPFEEVISIYRSIGDF